jgi:hypothetical protein
MHTDLAMQRTNSEPHMECEQEGAFAWSHSVSVPSQSLTSQNCTFKVHFIHGLSVLKITKVLYERSLPIIWDLAEVSFPNQGLS